MIEAGHCVLCEGPIDQLRSALVAPFVARRIWDKQTFEVGLVQCKKCAFLFYSPRLDDQELKRLYTGYRSDEYLALRHSFEPWYTREFNDDLASTISYAKRRATLMPILRELTSGHKIARVLDHGGDRGDLVAGLIEGTEAFVYDISGVPAAAGVTSVKSVSECKPDLIINSNVLEHVGDPRGLVEELLSIAPKETLFFFEVPCEDPFSPARIMRRVAQVAIVGLLRPRLAGQVLRASALFMMHEHINYFTQQTLVQLMRSSGASVLASGTYAMSARAGDAEMAWCLGMRT